ncbi:MAG TPA: DinB family protein [Anaerolineae bacterium]
MNLSDWFRDQLQASADGFVWGVEQVPDSRRNIQPPAGLGEWPAARHLFHMLYYEQTLALPSMRQWLGDARPSTDGLDEPAAWTKAKANGEDHLAGFIAVRAEQLALLPKFNDLAWRTERETIWGPQTLLWVVGKTYQHTTEHISDVMRIALFWDRFAGLPKA